MKKRILSLLLAFMMVVGCVSTALAATGGGRLSLTKNNSTEVVVPSGGDEPFPTSGAQTSGGQQATIADTGLTKFERSENTPFSESEGNQTPDPEDLVTFIVVTEDKPLLELYSVSEIAAQTNAVNQHEKKQLDTLNEIKATLQGAFGGQKGFEIGYTYTVATSGFSVTTAYGNRDKIAAMAGVKRVYLAPVFSLPEDDLGGELSPMTNNASTMIGAEILNASGYTGQGMRIAILDTGIDVDHPSFAALSDDVLVDPMTQESVEEIWKTLNASQMTNFLNLSYVSSKIPFAFNYNSGTFDVSNTYAGSDHGTHVAGIAAANKLDSTSVVGVAPDAQLIIMQVFRQDGGAGWDTIMAALEDCVRLEVDCVNLSLGAAAGFTDTGVMLDVMNLFLDTDIQVVIAAGNDTNNAYMNAWGLDMPLVTDPDTGLVGTPSTYSAALSVASANNDGTETLYFTVDGRDVGYNDSALSAATNFIRNFQSQTLEYVVIPGVGSEEDYEGLDVTGKVALVSRGTTSFSEKQAVAQAHGAIACVVYNNALGALAMVINDGEGYIPCVIVSKADGQYMVEAAGEDGVGTLTVCDGSVKVLKTDKAISSFSSWGVTPDLKLKPEITGVGGGIYSSVDPDISGSNYGYMSGTSMASPQITGAMAVLIQYLDENYPELTGAEQRKVAANLLMSTAVPILASEGLEVSPRVQGAGLANLVNATSSPAYFSNPNASEGRPKAEIGDGDSGVYTFEFQITNLSDEDLIYAFDSSIFTESVYENLFIQGAPYALEADVVVESTAEGDSYLKYDFNDDGAITTADARALLLHGAGVSVLEESNLHYPYLDINGDGAVNAADAQIITDYCAELEVSVDLLAKGYLTVNQIAVPANSTITLKATLTLTENDMAYMAASFPNGIYVEGYLYAENIVADAEGVAEPTLVMPILGFYGDWSDAPIFDDEMAEYGYYSLYPTLIYTYYSQLGTNPYFRSSTRVGDAYNAFSYANPLYEIDFGQLRNARDMIFTVTDTETGDVYHTLEGSYITKSYFSSSYGTILPTYLQAPYGEVWDGKDADGNQLPSGTTVNYEVQAWLDDGDDEVDDTWSFQVTLDIQAPVIHNEADLQNSLTTDENGATWLELQMSDNHYIAALIFMSPNGVIMGKHEVVNEPGVDNIVTEKYNVTGFGTEFTIILADYACNETEIDVAFQPGDHNLDSGGQPAQLDKGRIYGCETFDGAAVEGGWFSLDPASVDGFGYFTDVKNETYDSNNRYYSAEYVNGYLVAQNANTGNLELVTPSGTYWGTRVLAENRGRLGDYGYWVLYDMALDHSGTLSASYGVNYETDATDGLFAVGWYYQGDQDEDGKDDGYNALFNIKFTNYGSVYVQPVARITGTVGGAEMLTLGITTEGDVYGIDTAGNFYSIAKETVWDDTIGSWGDWAIPATWIATTDFVDYPGVNGANVIQSMGYDHNTGTMYWFAHSQVLSGYRYENINVTYTVDLDTGKCTEVGTYGPGGQTCLFVPNDLESDLFTMGVQPSGLSIVPSELTMVEGQVKRLDIEWTPWNAAEAEVTWSSSDETVAAVEEHGYVTALQTGTVTISATATVMIPGEWGYDQDWNWVYIEPHVGEVTATCNITIVPSEGELYSYIIADYQTWTSVNAWYTYADKTPADTTFIGEQTMTYPDPATGEPVEEEKPSWQGGTYYNGYIYTTAEIVVDDGTGAIGSASALYKSKVTQGTAPGETVIGEPELVGWTMGVKITALGFDYNTGRMYCIEDGSVGGLGIIDLDTGAVDMLGTYSGDLAAHSWVSAMCVTANGTIVVSDGYASLFTVDPDTLETRQIHWGEGGGYTYWEAMTYDYNTGLIYWNPCQGTMASPLCVVIMPESEWDSATVVELGDVNSKYGVQQTVLFTIPENEPATNHIDTESVEIIDGELVGGLVGGSYALTAVTTPARPTVQAKTWTSSDEDVVTVDNYGVLTYVGLGTATVTVSISNKDGSTFSDSIQVTVSEAAGEFAAFLAYDPDGSQYYDFWLEGNDYDVGHTAVSESMINIYSLRTGAYYDGCFYGYDSKGQFLRIDLDNLSDYKVLGTLNLDTSVYQITGMAMDYTTGTMYGLTLTAAYDYSSWTSVEQVGALVTIDLDTGAVTEVGKLDFSRPVYALACDAEGTLYAVGSTEYYAESATIYTLDKETVEYTEYLTLPGLVVYTDANYYGDVSYNSQMTYDFGTDRLYLAASRRHAYGYGDVYGMYMIQLGDQPVATNLGRICLQMYTGNVYENSTAYLGLLAFLPEESEIPVGKVNGVILNKTGGRIAVGGEMQLTAQVRPSNAADPSVIWSSSDESVATVDQSGHVTGISEGTAIITVTSNETGVSATCKVTVVSLSGPTATGYTVSAQKDALIAFNPQLPGVTAEEVATMSGGSNITGITVGDGCLYYTVVEGGSVFSSLYRYDLMTKQSTFLGELYTWVEINDIAYDVDSGLLYATAGFYLFQFDVNALAAEDLNYYTNAPYLYDSNTWDTYNSIGVEVVDGAIYVFALNYSNDTPVVLKYEDKYLSSFTVVLSGFALNMVMGATDVAYDAGSGLFYVTDAGHNIYTVDMDGNVEYIDMLGDGIDINGLAIIPAQDDGE